MAYQHDDQAVIGSVVSKPWQETLDARTFAAATQRPSVVMKASALLLQRSWHPEFSRKMNVLEKMLCVIVSVCKPP